MMRRTWPSLVLLAAAAGFGSAVSPALAAPEDAAPEAAEQDPLAKAKADYEQLQNEYKAAQNAYRKKRSELFKAEDKAGIRALVPTEKTFVPKYEAGAERYAGTEGAAPFLVSIAQMTYRTDADAAKSALDRLVRDHTGSPALKGLAFTLMYGVHYMTEPYVLDVMGKMIEQSPHADVKAPLLLGRGAVMNRKKGASDAERTGAVADLERALELGLDGRYQQMAKGTIFELTSLQIGMEAPDIEGKDFDDVAFKLSDYRGKVVVLDFWGDW